MVGNQDVRWLCSRRDDEYVTESRHLRARTSRCFSFCRCSCPAGPPPTKKNTEIKFNCKIKYVTPVGRVMNIRIQEDKN